MIRNALVEWIQREYESYTLIDANISCPKIGVQSITKDAFCADWTLIFLFFKLSCSSDSKELQHSLHIAFASLSEGFLREFIKNWQCFRWSLLDGFGIIDYVFDFRSLQTLLQHYLPPFGKEVFYLKQARSDLKITNEIFNINIDQLMFKNFVKLSNTLTQKHKEIVDKLMQSWNGEMFKYINPKTNKNFYFIKLPIPYRKSVKYSKETKFETLFDIIQFQAFSFENQAEGAFWAPFNGIVIHSTLQNPFDISLDIDSLEIEDDSTFNDKKGENQLVDDMGNWIYLKLSSLFSSDNSLWDSELGKKIKHQYFLGNYIFRQFTNKEFDNAKILKTIVEVNDWLQDANSYGINMNSVNKNHYPSKWNQFETIY